MLKWLHSEAAKAQAQAHSISIHGTREESIRNLQAILSQAQAQTINATKDYQRLSAVANKGCVSANELDSARSRRDVAVQQAKSRSS